MKKALIIFATVLVIVVISSFLYVFIGEKNAEKLVWEHLENKGYTTEQIKSIDINHSFLNVILSYNEWNIKVQYIDEPDAIYGYTIKDGKIVETGVTGDVDKEDLKHKH